MSAEVNILNRGDGDSPSVQRRGADRPEHIELSSPQRDFGGIAQTEEHFGPNEEVESPTLSTPSTLAVTVGTPLDHECPLCGAPKGEPCGFRMAGKSVKEPHFHYDRVRLIRVLP